MKFCSNCGIMEPFKQDPDSHPFHIAKLGPSTNCIKCGTYTQWRVLGHPCCDTCKWEIQRVVLKWLVKK